MISYYYVMAQLPALQEELDAPLSYDTFLSLMQNCVSKKDYALLKDLSLLPALECKKTGVAFLDRWAEYERSLRASLAKTRAENLNWSLSPEDERRFNIEEALDVKTVAREAVAISDPLQAERFLNKARISAVKQIVGLASFNRDALFAYAITLLLKMRSERFNVEAGQAEYKAIYEKILENEDGKQ